MSKCSRVLVIGLDSATFDIIDLLVQQGQLPNLARFMSEGSKGILRSILPPLSPQAWASFMTGVNPGRHGIFGFKESINGSYSFRFVNNQSIKSKTLWKYLSESGKRVVVINIPMTYPPEPVNGILISGMDAPGIDSDFTFPAHVKEELLEMVPDYLVHLHIAGTLDSDKKRRKAINDLYQMTEAREKTALHFLKNYDWDFFVVNFAGVDQIQHHFWRYMVDEKNNKFKDCIFDLYNRLDETVGRLTSGLDSDVTIFIMSDHGAGPLSDTTVYIDEWLNRERYVSYIGKEKKKGALKPFMRNFFERVYDIGVKMASSELKDKIQNLFPKFRGKARSFITQSTINWENTRIYSGENIGSLRFNLQGRDPIGQVRKEEYEHLLKEVIEKLELLVDPSTNDPLIERVFRRDELYWGEYVTKAPDLIIWPKSNKYRIQKKVFKKKSGMKVIGIQKRKGIKTSGTHRLEGIFLAMGYGIRKNVIVPQSNIYDLFPTIAYVLNMEIPVGLDGKVIESIFEEDYLKRKPIRYSKYNLHRDKFIGETYNQREAEQIKERLKGLGYLE